jgi:hypothetical protein
MHTVIFKIQKHRGNCVNLLLGKGFFCWLREIPPPTIAKRSSRMLVFLSNRTFVGSQHRKTKLYKDYWDYIGLLKELVQDFHSVYRILPTRELLLGLLGWREKRGSMSPLYKSPLGQPLVPRSNLDKGLIIGLRFLLMIPSFRASRG